MQWKSSTRAVQVPGGHKRGLWFSAEYQREAKWLQVSLGLRTAVGTLTDLQSLVKLHLLREEGKKPNTKLSTHSLMST